MLSRAGDYYAGGKGVHDLRFPLALLCLWIRHPTPLQPLNRDDTVHKLLSRLQRHAVCLEYRGAAQGFFRIIKNQGGGGAPPKPPPPLPRPK